MTLQPSRDHVSDADLLCWLDGEPDLAGHAVEKHLADCPWCHGRVRALWQRSQHIDSLLHELDVRSPAECLPRELPRRSARGLERRPAVLLRRAAVVALLLGAAGMLAGSPAGAALRTWAVRVLEGTAPPPPASLAPTSEPIRQTSAVTATPQALTWTVEFAVAQRTGAIAITARDQPQVRLETLHDSQSAAVLVLPHGMWVRNQAQSIASYHLLVPATLHTVRIEVAGRLAALLTRETLRGGAVSVELVQDRAP